MKKTLLTGSLLGGLILGMTGTATADLTNIALNGTASQSSTGTWGSTGYASNAIDGDRTPRWNWNNDAANSLSHTLNDNQAWWQVDLGKDYEIEQIDIYNRDDCCSGRLDDFNVSILDVTHTQVWNLDHIDTFSGSLSLFIPDDVLGRYVKIQLNGSNYLHLAEVEILSDLPVEPVPEPGTMLLLGTGLSGLAGSRRKRRQLPKGSS